MLDLIRTILFERKLAKDALRGNGGELLIALSKNQINWRNAKNNKSFTGVSYRSRGGYFKFGNDSFGTKFLVKGKIINHMIDRSTSKQIEMTMEVITNMLHSTVVSS